MGSALPPGTCAARLMLFVGGPSTEGAGKVVEKELSEPIRSHEVRMMLILPTPHHPSKLGLQCASIGHASIPQVVRSAASQLNGFCLSGDAIACCI